ncbi:NAD(P)H-binding protein [Weissella diestrammenae]|uniref:NAD(P)H-binding protein n=1 Tax=Weissella diestrammenae TaxID=1162633 RepID=A0A7G9T573_9LACO|nr:NAD(P)H-binding protein [Weissella diestrammenae]MCM0583104.1 NAD(P)H-binding protein [Weissella diestrammenae]QNN75248.1 NAD(P)H-binding protein [Weissella diestrammenae]
MKITILGAAGQISRLLIQRLLDETDAELVLFARQADTRLAQAFNMQFDDRITLVAGDFSDAKVLESAVSNADIVYLNTDHGQSVQQTLMAMDYVGVKRLIVAGVLGIYDEVTGAFGKWNRQMVGPIGERGAMIETLEASDLDYTYMRMTWLYNQAGKTDYVVSYKGEPFTGAQITRQAIVQYVLDLMDDSKRDIRVSVGLWEPGSEGLPKPSWY